MKIKNHIKTLCAIAVAFTATPTFAGDDEFDWARDRKTKETRANVAMGETVGGGALGAGALITCFLVSEGLCSIPVGLSLVLTGGTVELDGYLRGTTESEPYDWNGNGIVGNLNKKFPIAAAASSLVKEFIYDSKQIYGANSNQESEKTREAK